VKEREKNEKKEMGRKTIWVKKVVDEKKKRTKQKKTRRKTKE
jgi:hypothetical protein